MGHTMLFKHPGAVMEKIARDGHQFGHITENIRDSILAGATAVEIGVHGLTPDQPSTARRYIADNGTGMDAATLAEVFSTFSRSATTTSITTTLNPETGNTETRITPGTPDDKYHSRNGFGGRATLIGWNPLGVVTITTHQGTALMCWMYRSLEGEYMLRQWYDDNGSRRTIIAPYTEEPDITRTELKADPHFAKMLLVRSGTCTTEAEAAALIDTLSDTDTIPNPLAGLEWDGDTVPPWIIHHYDENGTALTTDGEPAHGTVKYLLGDTPTTSTALTGDPQFLNEADHKKYSGAGNHYFLDLTPWDIRIQTLIKTERSDSERHMYQLHGHTDRYRLESGSHEPAPRPTGRKQDGALPLRTKPGTDGTDPVEHRAVLDLTAHGYGHALIIVTAQRTGPDGKPVKPAGESIWGTSRKGIIAVVYDNEVHGLTRSEIDTADYSFRNMGIPSLPGLNGRVSVFLFPPHATDTTPGIHQDITRDGLRWSTLGDLPVKEINAAIREALAEQAPDLVALFYSTLADTNSQVDPRKAKALWKKIQGLIESGKQFTGQTGNPGDPANIADPTGDTDSTPTGDQGSPGNQHRDPCPECGQKIHAETCSRKPNRTGGNHGGTSGNKKRTAGTGNTRSRRSKARTSSSSGQTTGTIEEAPEPPHIQFIAAPPSEDNPELPAVYTPPPGTYLPATGTITINENHATVLRLYGVAATLDRDPAEAKQLVREWISIQLVETVYGTLSLHGERLAGKDSPSKTIQELGEILTDPDIWLTAMAAMVMAEDSLRAYITARAAAARRRKSKATPKPAEPAAA